MNNNNLFTFQIGSLVVLKSFPMDSLDKEVLSVKFSVDQYDMPIMVVHEIAHNPRMEKLYDVQSGSRIASKSKYLCSWFSKKQGCFNNTWFYEDQLELIAVAENTCFAFEEKSYPKIGDVVFYLTNSIERNKWIEIAKAKVENNDSVNPTLKKLNNFIPPSLCVKSILLESNPIVYDQKKGIVVSEKPLCLVKCVWYNSVSNKFSEELLPKETLCLKKANSTNTFIDKEVV